MLKRESIKIPKVFICYYRRYLGEKDYFCSDENCYLPKEDHVYCKLGRQKQFRRQ